MLILGLGLYEFVKKGDPPVMGLTKMEAGVTLDEMKRPRIKLPADVKAGRSELYFPTNHLHSHHDLGVGDLFRLLRHDF